MKNPHKLSPRWAHCSTGAFLSSPQLFFIETKGLAERMTVDTKGKDHGDDAQSQRILSRICGMCYIVEVCGRDFRMESV